MKRERPFLLLVGVALLGCPSTAAGPEPAPESGLPAAADVQLDGPCALESRFGGFIVQSWPDYSIVQGQVADGVVPVTVLEEMVAEAGCRLLRRNNPFCDPPCEPGETCDFDGTCIPYPDYQDLGTVSVRGLVIDLDLEPVMPGWSYFATALPHPAVVPDATVRVDTGDGAWPPAELWGVGVQDLSIAPEVAWSVQDGVDLELGWSPPAGAVRSEIAFTLTIDQHGVTPTRLSCSFEDTGEAVVPAALVDELVSAGVSGWPNAWLTRRTIDSTPVGDGCMDLEVSAPRTSDVDVVGYIPCDAAHPCPDGLECDLDLEFCM